MTARATEQRLNQIPQFRTTVGGLPIHFLHVRSRHPDAAPLVLTHGWLDRVWRRSRTGPAGE